MKLNSIINRYIFRELFPPFLINLAFLTFIFLMTQILDITNMIVNYQVRLWDVIRLLIFAMPFFLEFVIPMSVMMAILLTFLRLSGDNEIIALKTGGVSIYGLLPPVLVFCLVGILLTGFMAIYGLPWGRMAFKSLATDLAQSHSDIILKERTFNDIVDDVMLYVSKIDLKNKTLIDILIEDQRSPGIVDTIVAPTGHQAYDADQKAFRLRLYNGVLNRVTLSDKSVHAVHFDTFDFTLDLQKAVQEARMGPKDEEEMSLSELSRYIDTATNRDDRYYLALMEYHKKFAIPFACLFLGILAVPLGLQSRTAKRSFGIGLGLLFFMAYYMMLSAGWVFGEAGIYPPLIGMWVPNLVMGILGAVFLVRAAHEKDSGGQLLRGLVYRLKRLH